MSVVDNEDNLQEQRDEILALQSIYNTEDDHKVKIISEVGEDGDGTFAVVISVDVKPVSEKIHVQVVLQNVEDEEEVAGAAAASGNENKPPTLPVKVKMNRSLSGRKWEGSFDVKFLSPLLMYLTFPKSYPSNDAPQYHVACAWMSPVQIKSLSAILSQLWADASSMPIVFTWIDWLENSVLEHLGITDFLTLHPCPPIPNTDDEHSMDNVIPWEDEIGTLIASLVQYNRKKSDVEFCQSHHICEVCYDEKPGTQFYKVHECDHKFCHDCMTAFCEMHVTAGTVEELRCPDSECKSILPPYIVQAVLDPDAYDRWEKLLLQKTLDAMGDTTYCPRCRSLVIQEQEEDMQLAVCTVCMFSFCTECELSWHQGSACQTDEDRLEDIQKKRSNKGEAEQKRYDELIRKIQDDAELQRLSKKCPYCKIPVEKMGGCNKMTCKCGKSFCWLCGKRIDGYSHFYDSTCNLVEGQRGPEPIIRRPHDAVLRMRARLVVNPDLKQVRCPMCKQNNLKNQNNNHVKCWNCKTNFCFQCNARISGTVTDHFKGPCSQHSA